MATLDVSVLTYKVGLAMLSFPFKGLNLIC